MQTLPDRSEMYRALCERDSSYDGLFFVGVRTTGVFCRPICPARKPRLENVEFVETADEALRKGFRPCLRCRPMSIAGAEDPAPAWIRPLLRAVEREPARRFTEADLRAMQLEPARVRRHFRARYGMTFQAWHRSRRIALSLPRLRQGESACAVGFDHGFESSSGFRDAFVRVLGRTPAASRGAPALQSRRLDTPLGEMVAVADERGLCLLEFADRRGLPRELQVLEARAGSRVVPGESEHLERAASELRRYFDGDLRAFEVPLSLGGTPFQRRVWERLRAIPYGATRSYSALAEELGRPGAQRAVARANGDNVLAIAVPCHRVIGAGGELRGYGGGVWRKRWLLDHERASLGRETPVRGTTRAG